MLAAIVRQVRKNDPRLILTDTRLQIPIYFLLMFRKSQILVRFSLQSAVHELTASFTQVYQMTQSDIEQSKVQGTPCTL